MHIPWLAYHNPEIYWRTGEVQTTKCPEECGKKWRIRRQTEPGWQKQKEKEKQKEKRENKKREKFRRPTTKEKMTIARIS